MTMRVILMLASLSLLLSPLARQRAARAQGGLTVVATIPVGTGQLGGIAVNSKTNTIYVPVSDGPANSAGIVVIDGISNTVLLTIPVPGISWQLAVDPVHNLIYASGGDLTTPTTLAVINGATNALSVTIPLAPRIGRGGIGGNAPVAVDPATNTVYVGCAMTYICMIDGATATLMGRIPPPSAAAFAVDTGAQRVYLKNELDTVIYSFAEKNPQNWTTALVPGPNHQGTAMPTNGIAVNPTVSDAPVYVGAVSGATNILAVFSSGLGALLNPGLIVPVPAVHLVVRNTTGRVYSTDGDPDSTLMAIDGIAAAHGSGQALLGTLQWGHYTEALAINQQTGLIYVPDYITGQVGVLSDNS